MSVLTENGDNHNITNFYEDEYFPHKRLIITILCGISVGSIFLNSCVLISSRCLKRPVSFNLVLSLSLAASDGWSGFLIVLSLLLNRSDIYDLLQPNHCILLTLEMMKLSSFSTSVFHLLALALNHFLGIVYPMQHKAMLNTRIKAAVLTFLWLVPPIILFCLSTFVPDQGFQSPECWEVSFVNGFEFRNVICAIIFIPMLITFGFYFAIVTSLRNAQRDPLLSSTRAATKNSRKLFGTMILLMGTFVLGWLPSILVYLLLCEACPLSMNPSSISFFVLTTASFSLTILKLFSNPFIYALRIAELRRSLWRMALILLCKSSLTRRTSQCSRRRNDTSFKFSHDPNCSPFLRNNSAHPSPRLERYDSPRMNRYATARCKTIPEYQVEILFPNRSENNKNGVYYTLSCES